MAIEGVDARGVAETAVIQEIFSGIQGEGVLVGYRQVFVRFHGCAVGCRFCDTPASRGAAPTTCAVERAAGTPAPAALPNPLTVGVAVEAVCGLQAGRLHHSASLTGGEPLQQRPFLDRFIPALHARGLRTLLETNGLLPGEMASLAAAPHYLAMDIKAPSTAGIAPAWAEHAAFLETALRRLTDSVGANVPPLTERLQVKIVFGEDSLADVSRAAELVAACRTDIPCILQPVTPRPGGPAAPSPATVLEAQRLASTLLACVRVIPQTHVILGQR